MILPLSPTPFTLSVNWYISLGSLGPRLLQVSPSLRAEFSIDSRTATYYSTRYTVSASQNSMVVNLLPGAPEGGKTAGEKLELHKAIKARKKKNASTTWEKTHR